MWSMLTVAISMGVFTGGCAPSPTRPTIGLHEPTPYPLGIFSGVQRELRPVLAVTNVGSLGPVGNVRYQFDIAANPGFNPVLISGTVDEQQPQTPFTVPSDLATSVTYFWRTRALASAVASPYSATQSFATITAASPGLAALQLYFNASCRTFFGEREFTVYGHLAVSGTAWRFTVPPNANPDSTVAYDLAMNMLEAAGRLVGTIHGYATDPVGFPVSIYDASGLNAPTSATGALSANGGAAGTFSGGLHVAHPSFGIGSPCSGTDIPWVLTPSR